MTNDMNRYFNVNNMVIQFSFFKNRIVKKVLFTIKECIFMLFFEFYKDKNPYVFDDKINRTHNRTYYLGYWQSEKYFRAYRDDLLKIITCNNMSPEAMKWINKIAGQNSVSLHIRRGDYVQAGITIDESYYIQAVEQINKLVTNPVFYIFSDDLDFAEELIQKLNVDNSFFVRYKANNSTVEDMLIMSHCKHNIIANSSFSWWAAWLNTFDEKKVICPELGMWKGDFYPEEWIKIKL